MQARLFLRNLSDWVCPPALPSQRFTHANLQRERISLLLGPIIPIGYLFLFFLVFAFNQASIVLIGEGIIECIVLEYACLTLCHRHQSHRALLGFIVLIATYSVQIVAPLAHDNHLLPIVGALFLLVPISVAAMLLSNRLSYYVFAGEIIIVCMYQLLFVTMNYQQFILISIAGIGTVAVNVGAHIFRSIAARLDHSQQLTLLNNQLQNDLDTITEAHQQNNANFALSESLRIEFATIFDSITDGLIVFDNEYQLRHSNVIARDYFGIDWPHQLAQTIFQETELFELDGTSISLQQFPLMRVLSGESDTSSALIRITGLRSESIIVTTYSIALRNAAGVKTGALWGIRDVTKDHLNAYRAALVQTIDHACTLAADISGVAQNALTELVKHGQFQHGMILIRSHDHPNYAHIIGAVNIDEQLQLVLEEHLHHELITTDSSWHSLQTFATGVAYLTKPASFTIADIESVDPLEVFYASMRCLPLQFKDTTIGVLILLADSVDKLTCEDLDENTLQTIIHEIAVSLRRARLFEDASRVSLYDSLTGLSNHRALQDILHQELATGMAQSLPVSVIMLDIDYFRRFNEEYGHDIGDLVLKLVANATTRYLREGDYATRYGGEEFLLVFPGADSSYTGKIAEQIRQCIIDMPNSEEDELEFPFTISLGYATFPNNASAVSSLIKAAELALYAAKRGGRNRVVAYSPTLLQSNSQFQPKLLTSIHDSDEISLPSGSDLDAVQALVTAIDLRDGYTAAHSEGVSRYAVAIGNALGLPTEHIEALRLGGLIHDVGKIGVPDSVLRKPGKLDDAEWQQMKAHAVMGETILRSVEQLRHLLPLVRWHHERLDGTGYPDGLHGTDISRLVRILSIADVFEAFTAERPYHPGRTSLEGLQFLQQEGIKGKMDTAIIAVFADILAKQGYLEPANQQRDIVYEAA